MNGYVCFWEKQRVEVQAKTSYEAQVAAQKEFQKKTRKKVKGSDISVTLAENGGKQVTHNPVM